MSRDFKFTASNKDPRGQPATRLIHNIQKNFIMSIIFREAKDQDLNQICGLLMSLFSQEAEFKPEFEVQKKSVELILSHPETGIFLVVEKSSQIIGVVSLLFTISTALGGKVVLLEDLIIQKNERGKGIGEKLLRKAIEKAKATGCLRITLLTDHDNERSQQLYQKVGFCDSPMKPLRLIL